MKKSLVLAGLLLASSAAVADYTPFIGADIAYHDASLKASLTINGTTYSGSGSDTYVFPSLKAGIMNDKGRVYLRYDVAYDEDVDGVNLSYDSVDANFEAFYNWNSTTDIFYGAHLGMGWLAIGGVDDSGFQYGAQTGVIHALNDNVSIEAGVRYTKTSAEISATAGNVTGKIESDDVFTASIGINYKF